MGECTELMLSSQYYEFCLNWTKKGSSHCIKNYHIRPNYRTVRLNFSKALGKLVVKYPPNKGTLELPRLEYPQHMSFS